MADNRGVARVGFVLAFVAGVLALSAAAYGYYRRGEIDVAPAAGGLLMLALALGGWQASRARPVA